MTKPASRYLPSNIHRTIINDCDVRYLRAGSGTPVVFVHTLRTQLGMFLQVIERLDTTPAEVIAIDLPGHGESAAPPVDYTAGYFSDAVEALLDQLQLYNTVFVGESIGASIGLILAVRGNPRIAHVLAVNPYDYGRWGGARRSSPLNNATWFHGPPDGSWACVDSDPHLSDYQACQHGPRLLWDDIESILTWWQQASRPAMSHR